MSKVLIVGGTGQLGRVSVQQLRAAGLGVRCLVRRDRESDVTQKFVAAGAELVHGDLKDRASLLAACSGVDAVISMASATSSQNAEDTIETVDRLGNSSLVDAAASAKVPRFVFVAFSDIPTASAPEPVKSSLEKGFALSAAKSSVVERLQAVPSMTHTVLKPAYFMESWLPLQAPAAAEQPAVFFGKGDGRVSWIGREDVAHAVVAAAQSSSTQSGIVPLGGPEALSQLDVFALFQARGARKVAQHFVDYAALDTELRQARDGGSALGEAFAALKLGIAGGLEVASTPAASALLPARGTTVSDFVMRYLETTPTARG